MKNLTTRQQKALTKFSSTSWKTRQEVGENHSIIDKLVNLQLLDVRYTTKEVIQTGVHPFRQNGAPHRHLITVKLFRLKPEVCHAQA